jgi:glycosyltransferase involved in cell wall biosynthesis
MKILFVSYSYWPPDFGGELLLTIERLQSLVARGEEVVAFTSGRPGFPAQRIERGITVLRSPGLHSNRLAKLMRRLIFFFWTTGRIFTMKHDVLHFGTLAGVNKCTDFIIGWFWSMIARRWRARVFAVHALADSETDAVAFSGLTGIIRKQFLRSLTAIVAVSPALYRPLRAVFPQNAVLLLNGVRDDIFVPVDEATRNRTRTDLNVSEDDVVFSFLGSVDRRKGFDLLAEAFATLAPEFPRWQLWVMGPMSRAESQNVNECVARAVTVPLLPVQLQVRYIGRVDDRERLARYLGSSDLFVFPSRREGFGLAPVEAMAAGIPPIVARIGGVTDLANVEGETGLFVPPGDLLALLNAMRSLGTDAPLRQEMGRSAVERVQNEFGWEEHISRWSELYATGTVSSFRHSYAAAVGETA